MAATNATGSWISRPLDLLETGSPDGKKWAASMIRNLAATGVEYNEQFAAAGAAPLLMRLLEEGTPEAVAEAAGALRALAAGRACHQDAMVESGALPLFIGLLPSKLPGVPEQVAGALMNLMESSPSHRSLAVLEGAVPALIKAIRSKVVMVTLLIQNVSGDLRSDRQALLEAIIRQEMAAEVGCGTQPGSVAVGLTPEMIKHEAVQTPGLFVHCTVGVASTADPAAVQAGIKAAGQLGPRLEERLNAAKLGYNPLRRVSVNSVTTPAKVRFDLALSGVDCARVQGERQLWESMETRVKHAVADTCGAVLVADGVAVKPLMHGSEVLVCTVTPPEGVGADEIQDLLVASMDNLLHAVASGFGDGAQSPPFSDMESLSSTLIGEPAASLAGEPVVRESAYELSGTRLAQVFAAGALKNLVTDSAEHQDLVSDEGGVSALAGLLETSVPFGDLFSRMDRDSSGGISLPELRTGLARLGWHEHVDLIWRMLDQDRSGTVTFEEFVDRLSEELAIDATGGWSSCEAVSKLVAFLVGMSDNSLVHKQAAGALRQMTASSTRAATGVIDAGAVPKLIKLVGSKDTEVREEANGALSHVGAAWCARVVRQLDGGCGTGGQGGSHRQQLLADTLEAANLIRQFTSLNAQHRRTAVEAGGVVPLVGLLPSESPSLAEHAVAALNNMMYRNLQHEKAVVAAGAVPLIVCKLPARFPGLQAQSLRFAQACVGGDPISQRKLVDAGCVESLVALLKAQVETAVPKAIDVLMTLARSGEYSKQVMRAGLQQALTEVLTSTSLGPKALRRAEDAATELDPERQQQ